MPDRRDSAFNDPRFWVSATALLLTVSLAVLGVIASQLSSISGDVRAMVVVTTKQTQEIESLKKDDTRHEQEIAELRRMVEKNEKDQRDYNFKLGNDMKEIVTLLNMMKRK